MSEQKRPFYGREDELEILEEYLKKPTASLIVIRGRRRVGKSRLIKEYAKNFEKTYYFSGVFPTDEATAQTQREEFSSQLKRLMGLPDLKTDDWGDLFWFMGNQLDEQQTLIVLDEITWMGGLDKKFLPKFQNIWETVLSKFPKLVVIICGSVSAWINDNILMNTGFVGRVSHDLKLEELPLEICLKFWYRYNKYVAPYEILKVLAVTGGIPWYLEHINPQYTAETNIQKLAFTKGGVLFRDFERIFIDVFGQRHELYLKIVKVLLKSKASQQEMLEKLDMSKSGDISTYLNNLEASGFITREYTWDISSGKESKFSSYRLSDNYVRFYLKYIDTNSSKIIRGDFESISLTSLKQWDTVLGLQFENLVLNNRHLIKQALNINNEDLVYDNPYFQKKTQRQESCQIDYMVQTRTNSIYVCEIRFSKNKVSAKVIEQMQTKIARLKLPAGYTVRPVLIHVNGIEPVVKNSDFFVYTINFIDLFKK